MQSPHHNQPVLAGGQALKNASGALVLLHGRGGSAEDIMDLADEFDLPGFAYLAPHAAGHSWYPNTFLAPIEKNEPWLSSALELVGTVVERIVAAGLPREKIALMGFSQGACLTTEFAARNPARYGGVIAFTGGLIGPPGTVFNYSGDLSGTPCFLGSGDPDAHVPWKRVEESAAALSSLGGIVKLKRYPGMPHTISADEISEAKKILSVAFASGA